MNGLPYYKRYPRDFIEGTIGLPFEVKAAYGLILDLIYLHDGRCPDDSGYISGVLGCSKHKWASLRRQLLATGKIVSGDGFLANSRAFLELKLAEKYREKQRENASGPRKNKDLQKPRPNHTDTDTERDTLEANASNDAGGVDFAKVLFDRGVSFLGRHGTPERQARSLIGKWRKDYPDRDIFDAFSEASKQGVTDPASWIAARLRPRAANVVDWDAIKASMKGGGE